MDEVGDDLPLEVADVDHAPNLDTALLSRYLNIKPIYLQMELITTTLSIQSSVLENLN